MSEIVRLKTQTQIDNEAAVWTWRLDSGELTVPERGELDAWLRADARHRRAFDELTRTFSALDRLYERAQSEKVVPFASRQRPRGYLRKPYREAAAAAVLMVAIGASLWMMRRPGAQIVSTAVGQHRHVTLADGSQLTLNTNTLLAVKLTPARRDIYLRRGEAHFDVIHDASRPFFVHAGSTVIRDVGTQFEVRLRSDREVEVLVNEGQVEVQGPAAAAGQALHAGEQLQIAGPHVKLMSESPQQVADDLAWREGALVFQGEPLSQALAEVGRYTRAHIVLSGAQVGSLHISGRFRTDDVQGFFQALQAALPVRVSRPAPGLVYIAAR
jgi:transmembrane sensor